MSDSTVALRLPPELEEHARRAAKRAGMTLNRFIRDVLKQRLKVLDQEAEFQRRAKRGDPARAMELLKRMGTETPPRPGDEKPAGYRPAWRKPRRAA